MTGEELLNIWLELPIPEIPERLEAREAPLGSGIWLAVDHAGGRHLLVRVPDGTQTPSTSTKGLSVAVTRHRIAGQTDADYVDMTCIDDATLDTFAAVGAELGADMADVELERRPVAIAEILAKWRWFWGVTPDRLSERDALGLFAELWFLDQWAGVNAENIDAWTGSDSSRHDFQWPSRSVEVKATARRADGAVLHTIQHLDQLADPETGRLYLFSLRVVRDRLAGNTLPGMVDRCSDQLRASPAVRESLLRKISLRGYSPAHRRLHGVSYRILEERLYEVTGDFPRVTPASFAGGLPAGVGDVSYTLDMAACAPWLQAEDPRAWPSVP